MKVTSKLDEPLRSLLDDYLENVNANYDLRAHLDNRELVLCVGAGVTRNFIGEWKTLLDKLLVMRCYSTLRNLSAKDLAKGGGTLIPETVSEAEMKEYLTLLKPPFLSPEISTLETGEYLMYDVEDDAPYIGTQGESSYRECFFAWQTRYVILKGIKEKTGSSSLEQYFLNNLRKMGTLAAIVELCLKKHIANIITYNFDTILDRLLASPEVRQKYGADENGRVFLHSFQAGEPVLELGTAKGEEIHIYHVHGIIDEQIKDQAPIIFSENSYQSYQKTMLNWSNIRMADLMSRYHTLCVGFSGDDPNFRMLRHFLSECGKNPVMGTKEDRKELYLMRSYAKTVKNLTALVKKGKKPECAYACVKTYLELVNTYFEVQLGTHILWTDGFLAMKREIQRLARS